MRIVRGVAALSLVDKGALDLAAGEPLSGDDNVAQRVAVVTQSTPQTVQQFKRLGGWWTRRFVGPIYDATHDRSALIADVNSRARNEL